MSVFRVGTVILLLTALTGCAHRPPSASVHNTLAAQSAAQMPKKVLLLPADFRLHEISTGGVIEMVDAWSTAADANAMKSVREIAASKHLFQIQESTPLSESDKEVLEQHLALYERVASSADFARSSHDATWRERAMNFDYTLGPGLSKFADHQGVDVAVILIGSDYISTTGRKATMFFTALLATLSGRTFFSFGGVAYVSIGVVDMRTGNLLWFSTSRGANRNLREESEMRDALNQLLAEYPGAKVADAK